MKTSEEFLKDQQISDMDFMDSGVYDFMKEKMIEFAKLHCEAQAKKIEDILTDLELEGIAYELRNAYPLSNIK